MTILRLDLLLLLSALLVGPSCLVSANDDGDNASTSKGGMQSFLNSLRNFESGINPSLHDFYVENRNKPVYTYAKVRKPGRIIRDCNTGAYIPEPTTIQEFFEKIGVAERWHPTKRGMARRKMYRKMQYKSKNAWGFVGGYQMGEAILMDTGYYSPQVKVVDGKEYDSLYMFIDDSNWIGCKKKALVEIEGSGGNMVLATTINNWDGTFVGKNGVNSFKDLLDPKKQELVIRDAMRFSYNIMTGLFEKANISWEDALSKTWKGKDGKTIEASMSGLLAAAHLRGAWGTADLIIKGSVTSDELGTAITDYIHKFGGYSTLFDTPFDDVIWGSKYDETMSAGYGTDKVILGGGKNIILLHESPGSVTTIEDFSLGDDMIVLRDWTNTNPLSGLRVANSDGDAKLKFSQQTILLKGISASQIKQKPSAVIQKSDVYTLGWSGKEVVNDFNPLVDKVRGSSGIAFKHLKAYEADGSVYLGVIAADGGMYSYLQLVGLKIDDLNPDIFEQVGGSVDRLGYIVPLGWENWGWGEVLDVSSFDAEKTVIGMGIFELSFRDLVMAEVGNDVIISLAKQDDGRKVILRNVDASSLGANNFLGVSGSFQDMGSLDSAASPAETQGGGGLEDVPAEPTIVPEVPSGCPKVWRARSVYHGGDFTTYGGTEYEAKWWNQGERPASTGEWGVWKEIGKCQHKRRHLRQKDE